MSGFFKIERDFLTSAFWLSEPFTKPQAWVDLIGLANYAEKTKYYKSTFQKIKRGQIVTSQQALAERWKWSRHKVSAFLRTLERAEMVTVEGTTQGTLLTVVNYAIYQDAGSAKGTTKGRKKYGTGTEAGHRRDIQEEYIEEIKNQEERAAGAELISPSLEDVIAYREEAGLTVDAQAFWDYYEGTGWMRSGQPIKDWKAVMRGWEGKPSYKTKQKNHQAELDEVTRRWLEQ